MTEENTWGLDDQAGEEEISDSAELEAKLDELSFEDMRGMGLSLEGLLEAYGVTDKIRARSKADLKTKVLEAMAKLPEGHELDMDSLIAHSKSPVTLTPISDAVQEASDRATAAEESGSVADALRLSGVSVSPDDAAPGEGNGEMSAPVPQGAAEEEPAEEYPAEEDPAEEAAEEEPAEEDLAEEAAEEEPAEEDLAEEEELDDKINDDDQLVWFLCHPMRYGIALRDIVVNPSFDFREYPHKKLSVDEMRRLIAQGYHWNKRVSRTPEKVMP